MYEIPLPAPLKRALRQGIPGPLWHWLKEAQRDAAFRGAGPYSFDEAAILRHVDAQPAIEPFYVDIGAQDGVLGSQSLALAKRGWGGVAFEADPDLCRRMKARYSALPAVKVVQELVSPDGIAASLERENVPGNFGFLSLDIDSFDYYVLAAILEKFSPTVICVEINEMVPPPVVFVVEYSADAAWTGDRFQGFSIQAAKELCNLYGYEIGELHYNNLLLVKSSAQRPMVSDEDIARAYRDGYANKADRGALFPWNAEFNDLLGQSPETVVERLSHLFGDRLDRCRLEVAREDTA